MIRRNERNVESPCKTLKSNPLPSWNCMIGALIHQTQCGAPCKQGTQQRFLETENKLQNFRIHLEWLIENLSLNSTLIVKNEC